MDVIHHGAFEGVTGSCHELFLDSDHSLLVDSGLFQGAETSPNSSLTLLRQNQTSPDAIASGLYLSVAFD